METLNEPLRDVSKPPKKKGSARETLYRVTMQNQINSISIADQKANIIIGITTILISIIIATLGIGSSGKGLNFIASLHLSLPFTILLITSVITSIIALLTVRPVTRPWHRDGSTKIYFTDFRNVELDEFQEFMKDLLASNESIYSALNNDMYFLGKIVLRKFRLLRLAYVIFLVGMLVTVGSFFILQYI